jgi:hypothetical protein
VLQGAAMSKSSQVHRSSSRAPRWLLGLGSLVLIAQTGCGSSSDGPSPQAQCEALAEDTCDKLVGCASKLSGEKLTAADHKECVDSVKEASECSSATAIGAKYGECVDAIKSASCEDVYSVNDQGELDVNDLPSVCNGVIK